MIRNSRSNALKLFKPISAEPLSVSRPPTQPNGGGSTASSANSAAESEQTSPHEPPILYAPKVRYIRAEITLFTPQKSKFKPEQPRNARRSAFCVVPRSASASAGKNADKPPAASTSGTRRSARRSRPTPAAANALAAAAKKSTKVAAPTKSAPGAKLMCNIKLERIDASKAEAAPTRRARVDSIDAPSRAIRSANKRRASVARRSNEATTTEAADEPPKPATEGPAPKYSLRTRKPAPAVVEAAPAPAAAPTNNRRAPKKRSNTKSKST